jgi:hypothetical protein
MHKINFKDFHFNLRTQYFPSKVFERANNYLELHLHGHHYNFPINEFLEYYREMRKKQLGGDLR